MLFFLLSSKIFIFLQVAKEYLEGEIKKITYDDFRSEEFFRTIYVNLQKEDFSRLQQNGIGINTLKKFLGANCTDYYIRELI